MSTIDIQKLGLPSSPRMKELIEEDYPSVSLTNRLRLIEKQFADRQTEQPKDLTKPPENVKDTQYQFISAFESLMNQLKRLIVQDAGPIDMNAITGILQSYSQTANIYQTYVSPQLQANEIFRREIYGKLDQLASICGLIVNKINQRQLGFVDSLTRQYVVNDDFINLMDSANQKIIGMFETIRQYALTRNLGPLQFGISDVLGPSAQPGQTGQYYQQGDVPPNLPGIDEYTRDAAIRERMRPQQHQQPDLLQLEDINTDDLVEAYNQLYDRYGQISVSGVPKEDVVRDAFVEQYGRRALNIVDDRLNELEQGRLPRKFVGEPLQRRMRESKEPKTFESIDTGLKPRAPTMSKYYEPRSRVPRTQFKATQRDTQRLSEGTDTTRYIPSGFIPTTDQEMRLVRRFPIGTEDQPPPYSPPRYQDARTETSEMSDRMLKSFRDFDVLSKRYKNLQERLDGPVFQPSVSRSDVLREKRERSKQLVPVSREKAAQDLIKRTLEKISREDVQAFRPIGEFGDTPSFTEADIAADSPKWQLLRRGSVYNVVDEEGNFIGQRRKA